MILTSAADALRWRTSPGSKSREASLILALSLLNRVISSVIRVLLLLIVSPASMVPTNVWVPRNPLRDVYEAPVRPKKNHLPADPLVFCGVLVASTRKPQALPHLGVIPAAPHSPLPVPLRRGAARSQT